MPKADPGVIYLEGTMKNSHTRALYGILDVLTREENKVKKRLSYEFEAVNLDGAK